MTDDKLVDAFERGTAWVGSAKDGFEGATDQIITALRRPAQAATLASSITSLRPPWARV